MNKIICLIILVQVSFCKLDSQSKADSLSIFQNLGIFLQRSSRVTVSDTAVKGIIKNGKVTLTQLASDGTCETAKILASGETDLNGFYSLNYYTKTGGILCLTISSQGGGKTKVYDEKLQSDIAFSSDSDFKLVTIIPESKIIQNAKKNTNASPFSNMLLKRFQYLVKESGAGADINSLYKKASREVVIRFGLNKGFSAAKSTQDSNTKTVSENDYPELDDINFDLNKTSDPNTVKFISLMAGFSQLANQYKTGSQVSATDINSVINAFASDFEDGAFDGVGVDYKSISIGSGTNQVAFTSTPLTGILLPAVVTYIKEGGSLSVGSSSAQAPPVITTAQASSQIQFTDNSPIAASIPNPINRRPFPLSDTGQVKCFYDNAGTWTEDITCSLTYTEGSATHPKGQDALYTNIPQARNFIGPTAHTTFTNDYTTFDNVTGLTWKTCEEGKSGLLCTGTQSIMDQAAAVAACNAYNSSNGGAGYAGKTDWHLPTVQELSSVHSFNFVQAAQINTANFPGYTTFSHYWTSNTNQLNSANAWVLGSNGGPYTAVKTDNVTYKVRCVSGSLPATQSFTDNTNGTVIDNFTGLIWQKCNRGANNDSTCSGSFIQNTWVDALNYCEGLTLAGRSDWRLPNIKELETLVDYSTNAVPTIKVSNFPNPPSAYVWSSTSYIGGAPPQSAYYTDFNTGVTSFSTRGVTMDARCVTGP